MRLPSSLLVVPLASLLAFAASDAALAQAAGKGADDAPVVAPPGEFSEDARRAYAQGLRQAKELIAQQQYGEAIARLDTLLKDRPREPQARFLRAVALSDQGKRDEAIVALRDLNADYPELPEPHNNLAVLYAQKGEYELARAELLLAIASRPDYAVAHENLGDVYVRLAASQYERVRKMDATNKTAPAKLKLTREIVASGAPTPQP